MNLPPPIPKPDGSISKNDLIQTSGDWQCAPKLVRIWAYYLAVISIALLAAMLIGAALTTNDLKFYDRSIVLGFFVLPLSINIWLAISLRNGGKTAWVLQVIVSFTGLITFPIGTILHAYILSRWFRPETKSWFGLK